MQKYANATYNCIGYEFECQQFSQRVAFEFNKISCTIPLQIFWIALFRSHDYYWILNLIT